MTDPPATGPAHYLAEAQKLLNRLHGANGRDRAAFVLGYVMAMDAVAKTLPRNEFFHHHAIASALHDLCTKDLR
jgi:hypothetical protein